MPLTTPYVRTPYQTNYRPDVYDNRQETANMADLIRARGAALARGEQQSGDASRAMWLGIGQGISGTMNQLAEYALKAPERKLEQVRIADEMRQRKKAQQFEGLDQMASQGGMDDQARANLYEQEGYHEQANKVRDYSRQVSSQKLKDASDQLDYTKKQFQSASELLQSVFENEDPNIRAQQYATVLPKVREFVGPDLGAHLPDGYDEAAIKSAIAWGQTAKERLDLQHEASIAARDAIANHQDDLKSQEYWNQAFAKSMAGSGSAEEWEQYKDYIKKLPYGPPKAMIEYWNDYTPENVAKAKSLLQKSAPDVKLDDEIVKRYLQKHPDATSEDLVALKHSLEKQTGTGEPKPVTPAQKATASRWKANELEKIEANIRKGDVYTSQEEIDQAKRQVYAGYYDQLGLEDSQSLADLALSRGKAASPASTGAPAQVSAPPAATPAPAPVPTPRPVPQADTVLMESPRGERQYVRKEDVKQAEARGARVVTKTAPGPTVAPPAPVAPPPPPQQAWTPNVPLPGGPNAPPITVTTTEPDLQHTLSPSLADLLYAQYMAGARERAKDKPLLGAGTARAAAKKAAPVVDKMRRDFSKDHFK